MENIFFALQIAYSRISFRIQVALAWLLCFVEAYWSGTDFLSGLQRFALPVIYYCAPILAISIFVQVAVAYSSIDEYDLEEADDLPKNDNQDS